MKRAVFFSFLLLPALCNAQKIELALGGGVSGNTSATDNMPYKASNIVANYVGNLKAYYNPDSKWQFGIEANVCKLAGTTTHSYYNYNTHVNIVGSENKQLVYSRVTPAVMLTANYKIDMNRSSPGKSYFYGGVSAGITETFNNHVLAGNEAYLAPDGGRGYAAGVQLGYTKYVNGHLGFDVQAAARYYGLYYTAYIPTGSNGESQAHLQYGIVAVPVTIGIRYKFVQKEHGERMDNEGHHRSARSKHAYW